MKLETMEETKKSPSANRHDGGVVVELALGEVVGATFDLEKAVCSHGFFMMAPNRWDSESKTLERPLRLDDDECNFPSSFIVQINHPSETPHSLSIRVLGTDFVSNQQKESLLGQVRRMLRLSEEEEKNVRDFQEMSSKAKERGFGRMFRSPTLFEDMVKCMLLCNCQWPRTLSMAKALCDLQLEFEGPLSSVSVAEANNVSSLKGPATEIEHFVPKTPARKEKGIKTGRKKSSSYSVIRNTEVEVGPKEDAPFTMGRPVISRSQGIEKLSTNFTLSEKKTESHKVTSSLSSNSIGNFPSPRELANLDENILVKRCKLGYRASRILNLARSVVEGRIQLRQLEEACNRPSLSNYNQLAEQLKQINGFGPYTIANVLMCMGFYHVVPSDSETIRHIKQVHTRTTSIRTIERDIEVLYGKYAPFQFLAYWFEVWSFYEEKSGTKLNEMPQSEYKVFTATNLKPKGGSKNKRLKSSNRKAS